MDRIGYNDVQLALQRSRIEASVSPVPGEDGTPADVPFVTIEINDGVSPARVLNALALGEMMVGRGGGDIRRPRFQPLGVAPGSITLEDVKTRRQ